MRHRVRGQVGGVYSNGPASALTGMDYDATKAGPLFYGLVWALPVRWMNGLFAPNAEA